MPKKHDPLTRERARELWNTGVPFTEIARRLGVSKPATISRWCREDNWPERREAENGALTNPARLTGILLDALDFAREIRDAQAQLPPDEDATQDPVLLLRANEQVAKLLAQIKGRNAKPARNNILFSFTGKGYPKDAQVIEINTADIARYGEDDDGTKRLDDMLEEDE